MYFNMHVSYNHNDMYVCNHSDMFFFFNMYVNYDHNDMYFNMHVNFFVITMSYDMYFNVCINSNHIVPNESMTCILTCV